MLLFPGGRGISVASLNETAVVVADNLSLRKAPTVKSDRLEILSRHTIVRVVAHAKGWLKVVHEGKTGYVRHLPYYIRVVEGKTFSDAKPDDIEDLEKESDRIDAKIAEAQTAVKAFSQKEEVIVETLYELELSLNRARKKRDALRADINAIEAKMIETNGQKKRIANEKDALEQYAASRIVSLYKLSRLGTLNFLASADSIYGMLRRRDAMERILAQDREMLRRLAEKKRLLESVSQRYEAQKSAKLSLQADQRQTLERISKEKGKRARLLERVRTRKSLQLAAIRTLQQAADELNKTIDRLLKLQEESIRPGPDTSTTSFSALKGLLPMPVKGKIVSQFGKYTDPKYQVVNFRGGVDIRADRGEPIHSVGGGEIIFADWFRGFGNMVILDHGGGYYSIYAHAEDLFKKKGDPVEAGEVIATVGDTASLNGPGLYFEVRHHGTPMDPMTWFKAK